MVVSVVHIWIVGVRVPVFFMPVKMGMPVRSYSRRVDMIMVSVVMTMHMDMLQVFMLMEMGMLVQDY